MTQRPIPAPAGQPFNLSAVTGLMGMMGHNGWLGMTFHAESPDWIELALPWREDLVADAASGTLASGPIISLMDSVTGLAVWRKRGAFLPQVTADLRVDYVRAARKGRTVIGRGECYKATRSIGFVRGIAYDETPDDPVAHVAGTFILIDEARG